MNIGDALLSTSIKQKFDFVMESQWWDRDRIEEYQNEKLRQLILHAYTNVPYYNEMFTKLHLKPSDIRTKEDLIKIPILTKEIIRENFPEKLVAKNLDVRKLIKGGSSGSTGQPIQFYKTKDALSIRRSANLRGWYWTGFRLGDPYIKIATMPRNRLNKKVQDWLNRSYYVHSRSIDQSDIDKILNLIKRTGVRVVRGYPGSLYILATYLERNNDYSIKLDSIITTSEPLYPFLRKKIETMFQCKIYDSYSAEGSPIIFECPTHECYHIAHEVSIVEFLPIENQQINDKARMIVTDISNYATPFIRYDVKDIVVPYNSKCSCGREMLSVSMIEGRDTDILITPSGRFLTFYYFAGYFEFKDYVDLFQLEQTDSSHFVLHLVTNSNFKQEHLDEVRKDLLVVMGNDVFLEIRLVEDIPLTSSGKRRFLVRNKDIKIDI
jgi:phenylacetate-CoA ligase